MARSVRRKELTYLIRGSGIDLRKTLFTPEPVGPVTFVLAARMLRDNGVGEWVRRFEACEIGLPMNTASVPGCGEVVRDGITGLRVEPRDGNALMDAMLRLGQDPGLRSRMEHAARERAAAFYSIEDVVHDTFLVYDELLRG